MLISCQQSQETIRGNDRLETNKNIVRQYVEKFNAGDLAGLKEIFAEDALIYGVLGWGKVNEVMPIWRQLVDALEIQLTIEDVIAEGNTVAIRYSERGRSRGSFFDKPATGKSYQLVAMEWFVIKDGKIHRRWGARDAASQAKQLGWDVPATKESHKSPE